MIFIEPEKRIRDQEIAHFITAKVKNERAPILVLALARVRVFVKIGAVEFREPVRVLRKMRRHPIHDDADAGLMALVDKMTELIRTAVPARRRVVIRHLITPRTFERMLRHGHELDVGVTHLENVRQ